MEETRKTRVVLVAPHALTRLGLVSLLELIDGVQVVAHCGTAEEGLSLAEGHLPDIVLMDAELASIDGMAVVSEIKRMGPGGSTTFSVTDIQPAASGERVRVALIAERPVHSHVSAALEAGADAYTLKDITLVELSSVIDRLMAGETVLHPEVAALIARSFHTGGAPALTARQREILSLLAAGLENKQIARRLGIGLHTVKTHVSRVLFKLGAQSRTEAVVVALRDRLIS